MKTKVKAIFDIGKTNKKFFLFDGELKEVYREYTQFDEITDEDGFPTENLEALSTWVLSVFNKMFQSPDFEIIALNFSSYGASFVHIDENGKPIAPLYNYLKPIEERILEEFYNSYGPEEELSRITGSPRLGMLNSGMQLYWLKKTKPEVFERIKYSLHLPQYLSFLFTQKPVSDYTSIGCHTLLWDFDKNDYHQWVYEENIDNKLPRVVASNQTTIINYKGKLLQVGPGIHDSSAALKPYLQAIGGAFILVSTGTWSITINPFNKAPLSLEDLKKDSLFNLQTDGQPVRVSRLFLGNEYKIQTQFLAKHFNKPNDFHKEVKFDSELYTNLQKHFTPKFKWVSIKKETIPTKTELPFDNYENAYHQLIHELVMLQVESIQLALGEEQIETLYIDGGFSDNKVFIEMLAIHLKPMKIVATDTSLGSALGAAIAISQSPVEMSFLEA